MTKEVKMLLEYKFAEDVPENCPKARTLAKTVESLAKSMGFQLKDMSLLEPLKGLVSLQDDLEKMELEHNDLKLRLDTITGLLLDIKSTAQATKNYELSDQIRTIAGL